MNYKGAALLIDARKIYECQRENFEVRKKGKIIVAVWV